MTLVENETQIWVFPLPGIVKNIIIDLIPAETKAIMVDIFPTTKMENNSVIVLGPQLVQRLFNQIVTEIQTRGKQTAQDIIINEKKGAINSEFPKEWLDKTLDEIEKAARAGDSSARKAKKLLNDKRFDKGDNRK